MGPPCWDSSDLVRRVIRTLDFASQAVRDLRGPLREKVVAETAMLLYCVAPIQTLDARILQAVGDIATQIVPFARSEQVVAAICMDPGRALDHAFAHVLLTRLGYDDLTVDRLLADSLAVGVSPERLPHRRLEQEWLLRVWRRDEASTRRTLTALADSALGRPLDALGATRLDAYSFTHAVMYATDLGLQAAALPRCGRAIASDAVAALAVGIDAADHDLTAEVLLTWPLLQLAWPAAAVFTLRLLADVEDEWGFLTGSQFDAARYLALREQDRPVYALQTCYHTIYVMGFVCAAALRPNQLRPASTSRARRWRTATAILLDLIADGGPTPRWKSLVEARPTSEQGALAPLVLAITLRRACAQGDLAQLRSALEVALRYELTDGPAPQQAAALLRRSHHLGDRIASEPLREHAAQ
jgi:hypothetical protein